jgi:hypothetical protein
VAASSNGNLQFTTTNIAYMNACLPVSQMGRMAAPYWDDLFATSKGHGIYTSTIGTAPNRQFVIEWRTQYFPGTGTANFEAILNEATNAIAYVYGMLTNGPSSATVGLQGSGTGPAYQYSCNQAASGRRLAAPQTLRSGLRVNYVGFGAGPPPPAPPPPPPPPLPPPITITVPHP